MTDWAPDVPATLDEALSRAQEEAATLNMGRDATGQVGTRFVKYLTYPKLLAEVRPILTKNGLVWQSFPTTLDGKPALRYVLTHAPSHERQEEVMLLMMDKQTSQAQGSAITYARRYALQAVLDLAPDGDDDGAAASQPARPAPVDPEAPMSDALIAAMREALAERKLSEDRVLERAGWVAGAPVTMEIGRKVKALLDEHDAAKGAAG